MKKLVCLLAATSVSLLLAGYVFIATARCSGLTAEGRSFAELKRNMRELVRTRCARQSDIPKQIMIHVGGRLFERLPVD